MLFVLYSYYAYNAVIVGGGTGRLTSTITIDPLWIIHAILFCTILPPRLENVCATTLFTVGLSFWSTTAINTTILLSILAMFILYCSYIITVILLYCYLCYIISTVYCYSYYAAVHVKSFLQHTITVILLSWPSRYILPILLILLFCCSCYIISILLILLYCCSCYICFFTINTTILLFMLYSSYTYNANIVGGGTRRMTSTIIIDPLWTIHAIPFSTILPPIYKKICTLHYYFYCRTIFPDNLQRLILSYHYVAFNTNNAHGIFFLYYTAVHVISFLQYTINPIILFPYY